MVGNKICEAVSALDNEVFGDHAATLHNDSSLKSDILR
ncbi:hypothetical protein A2U01_0009873, partial [Trifolium medium]|nr:hypothetical protein [Trifolium medium]